MIARTSRLREEPNLGGTHRSAPRIAEHFSQPPVDSLLHTAVAQQDVAGGPMDFVRESDDGTGWKNLKSRTDGNSIRGQIPITRQNRFRVFCGGI